MKLYRVTCKVGHRSFEWWAVTLKAAHQELSTQTKAAQREGAEDPEPRVDLFDVPCTQGALVAAMNEADLVQLFDLKAERTWTLGPRGGLDELKPGE